MTAEQAETLRREQEYRDGIQADYDTAPRHMQESEWGLDRLRQLEITDRAIERMQSR